MFECNLICLDQDGAAQLRKSLPETQARADAAQLAKAFSEPNRISIAAALADGGELCGCDLSVISDLPQNLISHHLGILRQAGATTARRDGKLVMHELTESGRRVFNAVIGPVAPSVQAPSSRTGVVS